MAKKVWIFPFILSGMKKISGKFVVLFSQKTVSPDPPAYPLPLFESIMKLPALETLTLPSRLNASLMGAPKASCGIAISPNRIPENP